MGKHADTDPWAPRAEGERAPLYYADWHIPGCLPDADDLPTFDSPREAWQYIADEVMRAAEEVWWEPEDPDDPDGPQKVTQFAIDVQHAVEADRVGSIHSATDGFVYEVGRVDG